MASLALTAAAACGGGEMPSQSSGVNMPSAGATSTTPATTTSAAGGPAAATGTAGAKATTPSSGSTATAAAGAAASTPSSGSAGSAASAAGGAGADAAASGPTFTNVFNALFATSGKGGCFGCHGGIANPALNGNLAMLSDKAAAYKALVGAPSSPDSMCKEMTRVTAGDPTKSLLYLKIAGMPPCGMPMPPGTPLSAEMQTLVKDWIMAGAKDD